MILCVGVPGTFSPIALVGRAHDAEIAGFTFEQKKNKITQLNVNGLIDQIKVECFWI